jgi:hypothetical protein
MLYLFLLGGPLLYDVLVANLKIPSLRTVRRELQMEPNIFEGELQDAQLLKFLNDHQYEKNIVISEDATKIVEKSEYDNRQDRLAGVVLPFDANGMPILGKNNASTVASIKFFMTEENASYLYIIMAKPIGIKTKPFLLCYFGTSNKFNTNDVLNRWKYFETRLKEKGINILGYSSDGDSRLLKSMRIVSELPTLNSNAKSIPNGWSKWFFASMSTQRPVCIQDTVHVGGKFKTRLMSKTLKIGKKSKIVCFTYVIYFSAAGVWRLIQKFLYLKFVVWKSRI